MDLAKLAATLNGVLLLDSLLVAELNLVEVLRDAVVLEQALVIQCRPRD